VRVKQGVNDQKFSATCLAPRVQPERKFPSNTQILDRFEGETTMNFRTISLRVVVALLACLPVAAQTTYKFTIVNYPDDTFTQLLAINNENIIAGYHGATINKGFTYNPKTKVFTNENYPKSAQTQVTGINDTPKTVGFYIDTAGNNHGFEDKGGTFTAVNFPGEPFNQLLSQNNFGQSAGYYSSDASGSNPDHAYIYDEFGGVFEAFTIPGAVNGAQATGIDALSETCGFFIDSKNVTHGWLLVQGSFTRLDYPDSTSTMATGLNEKNKLVVGSYTDTAGNTHGFTYNRTTDKWQEINAPDGPDTTTVNGINDAGWLVGFYGTSPNPAVDNTGFIAVPE
jgi:hypothetical protein